MTKQAKNSIICRALLKYGHSSFSLDILEYCDSKIVIQREQYYIDTLKPEYNILQTAGSSLGYKHTEETLAKLRGRKHTEETLAKLRGRKFSPEALEKMRNRKLTEEHKSKIGIAVKAAVTEFNVTTKGMKVLVLDLETNIQEEYPSIRSAATSLNTHMETIRRSIRNKVPCLGKYLISLKEKV